MGPITHWEHWSTRTVIPIGICNPCSHVRCQRTPHINTIRTRCGPAKYWREWPRGKVQAASWHSSGVGARPNPCAYVTRTWWNAHETDYVRTCSRSAKQNLAGCHWRIGATPALMIEGSAVHTLIHIPLVSNGHRDLKRLENWGCHVCNRRTTVILRNKG